MMDTETFISQHANDDVRSLALQKAKYPDVDMNYALDQIAGRQMARHKLPSWATIDGIVYPPHLSMEQCSSEFTANYKAQLVRDLVRSRKNSLPIDSLLLVDLTAGFGVDFTMMAKALSEDGLSSDEKMVCVERQENLCNILRHNLSIMEINQTEVICGDGVGYLHGLNHACVVFLDPARRDIHGGRTFAISDCTPDVLSIQRELMEKSDFVILKLSPMLDIHATVEALGVDNVRSIHVVSVANECKELLVVLSKKQGESPQIHCVNDAFTFSCPFQDNTPLSVTQQINEGLYLYEPNASLMKTRCFGLLCQKYGVESIGVNSHLFVSSRLIDDFPGRKFRINAISSLNKKDLKNHLQGIANANITTRNFP
ncbi:MAG: SAM-dependent methyltransferase, partial [Prevotella sp.]|nr:SAM-dependent methyltransferase [Prevotella sp.]